MEGVETFNHVATAEHEQEVLKEPPLTADPSLLLLHPEHQYSQPLLIPIAVSKKERDNPLRRFDEPSSTKILVGPNSTVFQAGKGGMKPVLAGALDGGAYHRYRATRHDEDYKNRPRGHWNNLDEWVCIPDEKELINIPSKPSVPTDIRSTLEGSCESQKIFADLFLFCLQHYSGNQDPILASGRALGCCNAILARGTLLNLFLIRTHLLLVPLVSLVRQQLLGSMPVRKVRYWYLYLTLLNRHGRRWKIPYSRAS
jgi:hypothetical protein